MYRVESFGRDCLGNITGYVVATGYGWNKEIAGTFVGNIYRPGSFEKAKGDADALCKELNN